MTTRTSNPLRASLALVLAFTLAVLSSFVQGEGPELESYGNLCGPAANESCYKPALKGGFPLAYLIDTPGVSVERQLSFGEDTLHPIALVVDIAIYWAAIMLAIWFVKRQSASAKHSANLGEA
ncbi:hypothetical protein HLB44_36605 [Aquincola sp. S2]|uniref:Vitamin K epoxide reductase n=1 Tax=Pseudaquabacterium terrae TaxID=2732868 RepID=A0ABX2EUZ5_9BURK|nr:hypothetical protein [Aquabacterium terrae]NRF72481.1 hypothetical protein [Aquabacterium terrae]